MAEHIWQMVLLTFAEDPRMRSAAFRELYADGLEVEQIAEKTRLHVTEVQDILLGRA